jgi:hypothetical protein
MNTQWNQSRVWIFQGIPRYNRFTKSPNLLGIIMGRNKKPGGPRQYVTVYIPVHLRKMASDLRINLSELLEKSLKHEIKEKGDNK